MSLKSKNHENNDFERVRLLKPSVALYMVVTVAILLVWICIAFLLLPDEAALLFLALFVLAPVAVINPIAAAIAKRAERSRVKPGGWFEVDIQREKRRYGPLRAKRLFGHPVGKDEESQ